MQNFLYLTFSKKDLAHVFRPFPIDAVSELHFLYDSIKEEVSCKKLKEVADIVTDVIERFKHHASTLIIDTSSIYEMNFISVVIATAIRDGLMICFDRGFEQNLNVYNHSPYGIYKSLGVNNKSIQKNADKALSLITKRTNPWKQANPLMNGIITSGIDRKSTCNFDYIGTNYLKKLHSDTGEYATFRYPILGIFPSYITFVDSKDGELTA